MKTLACVDCSVVMVKKPRGAPPKRCPRCAKACLKAQNKAYSQKPEYKAGRKVYLKTYRQKPEIVAQMRAYNQSSAVKVRVKVRQQTSEYRAQKKAYTQTPEGKARLKVRQQKPEKIASERARMQTSEFKARARAWFKTSKGRVCRRRADAIRRGLTIIDGDITIDKLFDRDAGICALCNTPVVWNVKHHDPRSPSVDHIMPVIKGGVHSWDNVQLVHFGCNMSKRDRDDISSGYMPQQPIDERSASPVSQEENPNNWQRTSLDIHKRSASLMKENPMQIPKSLDT